MTKDNHKTTAIRNAMSLLAGPVDVKLWNITIGQLLKQQIISYPSRPCLVFSDTGQRYTYNQLYSASLAVSKSLMAVGIKKGNCVGILAGNCSAYVELLFATAHIGAIFVVFNCSYTATELMSALKHSGISNSQKS